MKLSDIRSSWRIGFNWAIIKFSTILPPGRFKNWLLRRTGADIHKDAWISPDVIIDPVFPELITITDNAFIGWGTKLFTHMITPRWEIIKEPIIVDGFVGGDCTIEPGCKIYGILGAHSYLRRGKIIQRGQYWYGIPAHPKDDTDMKEFDEFIKLEMEMLNRIEGIHEEKS